MLKLDGCLKQIHPFFFRFSSKLVAQPKGIRRESGSHEGGTLERKACNNDEGTSYFFGHPKRTIFHALSLTSRIEYPYEKFFCLLQGVLFRD